MEQVWQVEHSWASHGHSYKRVHAAPTLPMKQFFDISQGAGPDATSLGNSLEGEFITHKDYCLFILRECLCPEFPLGSR